MAETNVASVFSEILANIKISSLARLISQYPGVTLELPHVLEQKTPNVAHATDQGVKV
jgi:hypothetical protein